MTQELASFQKASKRGFVSHTTPPPSDVGGNNPTISAVIEPITKNVSIQQFTFETVPPPGLGRVNIYWVIEPWTNRAERFPIYLIDGSTGYLNGISPPFGQGREPLVPYFSHPAGSRIAAFTSEQINPIHFGAVGDGSADDWRAWMKCMVACRGGTVHGGSGGPAESGIRYRCDRPLTVMDWWYSKDGTIVFDADYFDMECVQTNLPGLSERYGYNGNWHVALGSENWSIPQAGTEFIIEPGVQNRDTFSYNPIKLSSIWDENMPPELVEMKLYKVINMVADENRAIHCQLEDYDNPGVPIQFSRAANGECWYHWGSHIHHNSANMTIESNVPDLDLWSVHMYNQPSRSHNLTIRALADTGDEWACSLSGQLSDHSNVNVELGSGGAKVGVRVAGPGNIVDAINVTTPNGDNPDAMAVIGGGSNTVLTSIFSEGVGLGYSLDGSALVADQIIYVPPATGAVAAFMDRDYGNQYTIKSICAKQRDSNGNLVPALNVPLAVLDLVSDNLPHPKLTLYSWDGNPASGVGDTDEQSVFPGLWHPSLAHGSMVLMNRLVRHWKASDGNLFKMRRIYKGLVLTSDAACDVWLAPMNLWLQGHETWIRKTTSSNNLRIFQPNGTQIGNTITAAGIYRFMFMYDVWVAI